MAKRIIIDRLKWIRGDDTLMIPSNNDYPTVQGSMLLRPADGKMCCIGMACIQLGADPAVISHMSTIEELLEHKETVPVELTEELELDDCDHSITVRQNGACDSAYEVNDDTSTTDAEKEAALVPLFESMGLEVEFIN